MSHTIVNTDDKETAEFDAIVLPEPVVHCPSRELRIIDPGDGLGWRIEAEIDGVVQPIYWGSLFKCLHERVYREDLFSRTGRYE